MSNLPSFSDLETDDISLGLIESFKLRDLLIRQTETGDSKENPGQFLPGEHIREIIANCPKDDQPRITDSGVSSNAAEEDTVDNLVTAKSQEEEDINNEFEMTVAKVKDKQNNQSELDHENSARTASPVVMETAGTGAGDDLPPLQHEFTDLTISEPDIAGDENAVIGQVDDWSELEESDEDGDTMLHQAIILNNQQLASLFIQIMTQVGLDLNSRNLLFQTPLHLAILTEQGDLVQQLAENGADITIRDKHGRTPLHIACEMRRPELVDCLLNARERASLKVEGEKTKSENVLDIKNYEGEGCVHVASKCGDVDLMKCLIKNGANVNLADEKSGRTALHFAAENNDTNMVGYLLGIRDVITSPETLSGETPILLGYLRDFDEIVELIKRKQSG